MRAAPRRSAADLRRGAVPRAIVFPVPVRLLVGVARVLFPCAFLPLWSPPVSARLFDSVNAMALLIASCTEATLCW